LLNTYFMNYIRPIKITVLFLLVVCSYSSCLPPLQSFFHIVPDEKDVYRFKYETVKHADSCFEFKKTAINKSIYVTNWTSKVPLIRLPLDQFLQNQKAKYFIVIKDDSIVYEYTDSKIKKYNPVPSFSISKTFVSACLGIAMKQGYIGSINDRVKDYLPELNYHKNFDSLTINHLLNQKSGLKMKVPNVAHAYYGKVENVLPTLTFVAKPGEHFEYININYTLLGLIIERATKQNLHEYFSTNIWSKIGTCDSSVWGYDYKSKHTRAIGCFAGSARDYAKFGMLYMNKGVWAGQQLIDSNWITLSTSPVNPLGEDVGYNNSWFIGEKEIGDYMALGMYRQQIYINPKHRVIIVSLMKFYPENLELKWWQVLRQITEQVE
jgi:CubicO group peptidase (beta-lactamase class C family)